MGRITNPFAQIYSRPAWSGFFHPTSVGAVTAVTLAMTSKTTYLRSLVSIPRELANPLFTTRGSAALLGFILGFGLTKSFDWARWRLIQMLLSYQGWLHDQTSLKTKLWAITLRIAQGPGPKTTYQYEDVLPRQPLPSLDETLDRYLEVSENLVSPEDFALTKEVAEEFRKNEGPKLQAYLENKKATSPSWLADYWLHTTYLGSRESLAIYSNYHTGYCVERYGITDPIILAAGHIHRYAQFYSMIESERLLPLTLNGCVPISMYGYKTLYSSTRIADKYMDKLARYPDSKHIAVARNGHYFKLDMYAEDETTHTLTPLTPEELKIQLIRIVEEANKLERPQYKVASLTGQKRNVWAEVREKLLVQSKEELDVLESAIFHLSLEIDTEIESSTDLSGICMRGDGSNRWFDKCFTAAFFKGGNIGFNVEHSFTDGTYFGSIVEHSLSVHPEFVNGDIKKDPFNPPRELQPPSRVQWNLEGLEEDVLAAEKHLKDLTSNCDLYCLQGLFGKGLIKKLKVSPDGFFQMILQLSYYRMHKACVKTYAPATGRLFGLGRTETSHTVSKHSVEFVKAFEDKSTPKEEIIRLFRAAIKHQSRFRLDATRGYGCDRHLLGLYCAAREMGMDVPQLYSDKSFQLPWLLSTSQTPTRLQDIGVDIDYRTLTGGFGPLNIDGYGISYCVLEDVINVHISHWKSSEVSDCRRFAEYVADSMEEMATLLGYEGELEMPKVVRK